MEFAFRISSNKLINIFIVFNLNGGFIENNETKSVISSSEKRLNKLLFYSFKFVFYYFSLLSMKPQNYLI